MSSLDQYFFEKTKFKKILNVRYNTQRDNLLSPNSACNVTSVSMQIDMFLSDEEEEKINKLFSNYTFHQKIISKIRKIGFKNLNIDDKLFAIINSFEFKKYFLTKYPKEKWTLKFFENCNANEVYLCLVEVIRLIHNSNDYATMNRLLTLDLIIREIDNAYPVTICGKFTGGHFVCVIGYDLINKLLICHDSWGDWNSNYKNQNGAFVKYSFFNLFRNNFLSKIPIVIHYDKRLKV